MEDWAAVREWRRAERKRLLEERAAVPLGKRRRVRDTVADLIRRHAPDLGTATVGFYWPIKGELDLRPLIEGLVAAGAEAALPVVVTRGAPVEFWRWRPRMRLKRGFWDIPVPPARDVVHPDVLLIPLVGFDEAGYRLGYGGGYYDRTLANFAAQPLSIGVGYAFARLATIHPQPHDVPMDAIATEAGFSWYRRAGTVVAAPDKGFASLPSIRGEADPAPGGCLGKEETIAFLNQLLEAERAGAKGVAARAGAAEEPGLAPLLRALAQDEARFCAMLARHVARLGGSPSAETGDFLAKLAPVADTGAWLDLLNRGQGWVARKLGEALPRIHDDALRRDLEEMLAVHEQNIARCTQAAESVASA